MTVGDLIKRLEKIDKECVKNEGWASLDIQEKYYYFHLMLFLKKE